MRILHVFDHSIPLHSGYTFRSYQILQGQRALGYETVQLTGMKQGAVSSPVEDVDGLSFYRTTAYNSWLSRLPLLGQYEVVRSLKKRLRSVVQAEKPDIIQAHSPVLNGMAAVAVGREFNIPVLYEIRAFWEDAAVSHGSCREGDLRYRLSKALENRTITQANAITVICDGLKQDLVGRGVAAEKITLIPNAVDITKFTGPQEANPDLQQRLGLNPGTTLGFIGSFYDYEGLDILIASLPMLLRQQPKTRLLLVGGGPQEQALKQQVADLGLHQQVIFTGRVPHDKVQDYYNLVDIFVYPRKKMRLTDLVTPLKPLEAMAQHKLVAASSIGGHRELIEDGRTGILFKPDNPLDLARTIGGLLHKRDGWPQMIKNGRRYVQEVRNWPNSIAHYPAVFESLLNQKSA